MKRMVITLTIFMFIFTASLFAQSQLKTPVPEEIHLLQHPFKPMNIILIPANVEGITAQPGDLVMAFAGDGFAGAAIVEDVSKVLNLVASSSDNTNKRYKAGESIRIEYHSLSDNTVYDLVPIKILLGSMNYEELGTLYAEFKASALRVEEIENTPAIKVYPNPVSQQLHVVLELDKIDQSKNIKLQLINLSGAVIIEKEFPLNQSLINLDVANLPTGEYPLVVANEEVRFVRKVIKK